MPRPKEPREIRVCERCGNEFVVRQSVPQRYCGRACARQVDAIAKSGRSQAEWEASPQSYCPCGIGRIPYVKRHYNKYCSDECRLRYGKKRQANPANYVTFNCRTCGKEVTRYKNYGNGSNLYCSNECASKFTHKKHHVTMKDSDVLLDSAWEAAVWGVLHVHKIAVERADRSLAVEWSPGCYYAPDFYLPSKGLWIEVKGLPDPDDETRWAAWRVAHGPLLVLDESNVHSFLADPEGATFTLV